MKSVTSTLITAMSSVALLTAGLLLAAPAKLAADTVSDFYASNNIEIIVAYKPGGGYDAYARLVARHLGKYIPGNPEVTVINRPGAGGLVATNYLYNRAPKNGTAVLVPSREVALSERLGAVGLRYKTLEMPILGSAANVTRAFLAGSDVPVENLDDLAAFHARNDRDFRFATDGKGSGAYQLVQLLSQSGYPVEVIAGYKGTADTVLAVLRGETDGMVASYDSGQDLIRDEGFKVFAKLGNNPALTDTEDLRQALTDGNRALANIFAVPLVAGRPFFTAPGTSAKRVAILQEAFHKALEDEQLQVEAERASLPISYTAPGEVSKLYREILNATDEVIAQYRD